MTFARWRCQRFLDGVGDGAAFLHFHPSPEYSNHSAANSGPLGRAAYAPCRDQKALCPCKGASHQAAKAALLWYPLWTVPRLMAPDTAVLFALRILVSSISLRNGPRRSLRVVLPKKTQIIKIQICTRFTPVEAVALLALRFYDVYNSL